MSEMVWEDPPPVSTPGRGNLHSPKAHQLRDNPGKWAVVGSYGSESSASSMARTIRTGATNAWKPGGAYEAVARGRAVYARYVGEPDV